MNEQLEAESKLLAIQISTLMERKRQIDLEIADNNSREFIRVNQIKKSDVVFSDEPGLPWFGIAYELARWIRHNRPEKMWMEWNTKLFLIGHVGISESPAYANHVT